MPWKVALAAQETVGGRGPGAPEAILLSTAAQTAGFITSCGTAIAQCTAGPATRVWSGRPYVAPCVAAWFLQRSGTDNWSRLSRTVKTPGLGQYPAPPLRKHGRGPKKPGKTAVQGRVFAQRGHSAGTAPVITVIIQVTTLKTTHLRNHAQSIQNSKIQASDACHGSQGPKFCPL